MYAHWYGYPKIGQNLFTCVGKGLLAHGACAKMAAKFLTKPMVSNTSYESIVIGRTILLRLCQSFYTAQVNRALLERRRFTGGILRWTRLWSAYVVINLKLSMFRFLPAGLLSLNKRKSHLWQGVCLWQHSHGRLGKNLVSHKFCHFSGDVHIRNTRFSSL